MGQLLVIDHCRKLSYVSESMRNFSTLSALPGHPECKEQAISN